MKITLTLNVVAPEDHDPDHAMGITNDAYERLTDGLIESGFEIASGPDQDQTDGQ